MNVPISEYFPVLIPLLIIQLGLLIAAVVHILKNDSYRLFNRAAWIVICVLINIVGPLVYFMFGRGDGGERDL